MPKPEQGRIVLADVLDPQSRNKKCRPVVIVTPTDEIEVGELFQTIAVTGTLPKPLPPDHVLLPYHPNGHPRTGLTKKSAAVCTWMAEIHVEDIKEYKGIVPAKQLSQIVKILESLE